MQLVIHEQFKIAAELFGDFSVNMSLPPDALKADIAKREAEVDAGRRDNLTFTHHVEVHIHSNHRRGSL
jgi:hypothetical protein